MGSRTPQLGQGPAGNRSETKRTAWLCGPAVALDCRANLCMAGPMATAQGRLRVFAGNDRGTHSHCDDSAHAAKIGADLTFSNALSVMRCRSGVMRQLLCEWNVAAKQPLNAFANE